MVHSQFFATVAPTGKRKLACLVAGFAGKIRHFKRPIAVLQAQGYDVLAFEYDNHILDTGDPQHLRTVITDITATIRQTAARYDELLCTGASLGAYIAINVQRQLPQARLGIYGTAGVQLSHVIFHSKVFYKIRRMYVRDGYDEASLLRAWQEYETLEPGLDAQQSLVIVLGRSDRIIFHADAVALLEDWRRRGIAITYISKRGRGHSGTIGWYRRNFAALLQLATTTGST